MNTVSETVPHSNFIGGSSAARRINCPASYKLELQLPASARKETSVYAEEGTALHEAIAHAFRNGITDARQLVGMTFNKEWTITPEMADEALQPYFDYFDALDQELGGIDFMIESRVQIPFLPGVFGTADIIGRARKCSVLGDYKGGIGELVNAWYETDDGEIEPNEQLMFYTLAATNTHPQMFECNNPDWPIEIFIAQPRYRDGANFDRITVTMRDVTTFGIELAHAAHAAQGPDPLLSAGSWCRFCPAKVICPKHTGPMLDAVALAEVLSKTPPLEAAIDGGGAVGEETAAIDWGETYRLMLTLASRIEPVIKEWRSQATVWLEQGNKIGGYKLVPKRGSRKWIKDEKEVEKKLTKLGLKKDQRMPRTLVSPPQAEKILQTMDKELPAGFFDVISSGVTLAPVSDKRQAQNVADIAKELGQSLALIMENFELETREKELLKWTTN
jgi:Protein of unknown function (DUF2800)